MISEPDYELVDILNLNLISWNDHPDQIRLPIHGRLEVTIQIHGHIDRHGDDAADELKSGIMKPNCHNAGKGAPCGCVKSIREFGGKAIVLPYRERREPCVCGSS